ncbi:MAG: carbohydrate kinase [Lachnospiraceae bacterium]|nr:carbohydrate kinase [Lachnospiraceae bacterium]
MRYFIGLDNGGTATKAAVFDRTGKQLGSCSMATAMLTPKPEFVERDMEEMWDANCAVVKGVLEKTGIDPADVAGIGVAGHGKGLYLWGKDDKPVRNGIISTDNRAYRYVEGWKADGTEEKVFELSCQHIMNCQPVALLAWIKEHEPENYQNIRYVFECKDYVRFRLTGEARAEITDYSGANLMNLKTRAYDPQLLGLFGIEEVADALPPLCRADEIAGYITAEASAKCGLKEGTPVVGGFFDINACAVASGVITPDLICMIAGTWSINEYIRKEPVLDGKVLMNSLFCLPEYYLIEESSPTSAGNNEWFVKQLLPEAAAQAKADGTSIYEVVNGWVDEVGPKAFVPVFLPFLMASNVHPNAKSVLVGMNVSHNRKHIARSIYEGIAFCHRYHLEKLLATRDEAPKAIRLSGGAARSKIWSQMFADICQLPVETVAADEAGALGCAIAAAVATGEYATLEEAIQNMTVIHEPLQPNKELKEIYDRKYQLYVKTIECLDGLWDQMQEMVEAQEG